MVDAVWVGSPNFHSQTGIAKKFITLHWMVGNLLGTDRAFNSGRAASSTYGVEGNVVHQYVLEKDYPYSDGNTYANQHTISIEHAGGWLLPDGSRFKPTPETHETSAQLCADIARRHGFGKLVVGVNIFPHNHWVATACPGSLDIQWIANRANEINGNPDRAVGVVDVASVEPQPDATILKVQTALKNLGYNPGPLDGIMGPLTRAAVVAFQQKAGGLVVDGIPGPLTQAKLFATPVPVAPAPAAPVDASILKIQTALKARGFDPGPLDGIMGPRTKAAVIAFQKSVGGLVVDGIPGPATQAKLFAAPGTGNLSRGSTGPAVLAVQTKLRRFYPAYAAGLALDGIFGPATEAAVREFQRRAGLVVDGIVGPATRSRLGV